MKKVKVIPPHIPGHRGGRTPQKIDTDFKMQEADVLRYRVLTRSFGGYPVGLAWLGFVLGER